MRELLESQMISMKNKLAYKTFVHFDSSYGELSRKQQIRILDESEIEEYNKACIELEMEKHCISPFTQSEKMLKQKWHLEDIEYFEKQMLQKEVKKNES